MENKRRSLSLTRRAEYLRLKERGRSFHVNHWLLVNYEATDRGQFRNGWTIPTYVGNAVVRNRLRRWGREFVRRWRADAALSADVNLVFKRRDKAHYRALTHADVDQALGLMVRKLVSYLG